VIITLELTTATSGNSQHRRMPGPFTLETRTLHPWAENCKMKMWLFGNNMQCLSVA